MNKNNDGHSVLGVFGSHQDADNRLKALNASGYLVDEMVELTLTTVAVLIVRHGISVTPMMGLYSKRIAREHRLAR